MDVRQAPDDLARLMGSSAEAWDIADLNHARWDATPR